MYIYRREIGVRRETLILIDEPVVRSDNRRQDSINPGRRTCGSTIDQKQESFFVDLVSEECADAGRARPYDA
jgi:hypothetical protein